MPYAAVFEGEPLVLRCRGWYDKAVYRLHYYRDGRAVRYFSSGANYSVPQARAGDSGRYQCSGTMRLPVESAPMFSAPVAVTVQGGCTVRGGCDPERWVHRERWVRPYEVGGPGSGGEAQGREPGGEGGANFSTDHVRFPLRLRGGGELGLQPAWRRGPFVHHTE